MSQEKWEKTRGLVRELAALVEASFIMQDQECKAAGKMRKEMVEEKGFSEEAKVPRQELLEIRGFLNYVARTYAWLAPFTKGMHNTIDGWCFDQDTEGWKLRGKHLEAMLEEQFQMSELIQDGSGHCINAAKVEKSSSDPGNGNLVEQ